VLRGSDAIAAVLVNHPLLVIVEAKRRVTLDVPESEAELFGQLRVLMMKEYLVFANFANGKWSKTQDRDYYRWNQMESIPYGDLGGLWDLFQRIYCYK
jgi:hypothetical protein